MGRTHTGRVGGGVGSHRSPTWTREEDDTSNRAGPPVSETRRRKGRHGRCGCLLGWPKAKPQGRSWAAAGMLGKRERADWPAGEESEGGPTRRRKGRARPDARKREKRERISFFLC